MEVGAVGVDESNSAGIIIVEVVGGMVLVSLADVLVVSCGK